jgi:hypothetical protein
MTKSDIITKFHLYFDDGSELSSSEESDLFDKIYQEILSLRPWLITRKVGTATTSTTVPYVSLPADFAFLTENVSSEVSEPGTTPVVFVGTAFRPYKVISFPDRRNHRDQDGYCYVDIATSRLVFTRQPSASETVEFDYSSVPANLLLTETPIIPTRFQDIIYHKMLIDQNIIDMSDKAKSYAGENQVRYKDYLSGMEMWDSRLQTL